MGILRYQIEWNVIKQVKEQSVCDKINIYLDLA